jgi:hypothetical protein
MEMLIKLNTDDLKVGDAIMRKCLKALTVEELDLITDCKLSQTILEIMRDPNEENQDFGI